MRPDDVAMLETAARSMPGGGLPPDAAEAASPPPARRRWDIIREQLQQGHDPCFASARRHVCGASGCPWRPECTSLRAHWRV